MVTLCKADVKLAFRLVSTVNMNPIPMQTLDCAYRIVSLTSASALEHDVVESLTNFLNSWPYRSVIKGKNG
jgi:hypothetical protein